MFFLIILINFFCVLELSSENLFKRLLELKVIPEVKKIFPPNFLRTLFSFLISPVVSFLKFLYSFSLTVDIWFNFL